ncbi:MAG TPA: protein kinase [Mycobacteriales bacterium]|nr:protein kinase [Mycobacteriales bacterium]
MSAPVSTDLLDGRYRLTQRLAAGGMGVVWRAWDDVLGREVAVKLIRAEYADDPTFRQRLRAEARAIASIRSPHVVRIHDVCEEPDPDGGCRAFLVMELIDGESLSTQLQHGPLTVAAAGDVLAQLADALTAAQACQVVHRDIKPGNVIVDGSGHVTLLDFGIARAADGVALTTTGTMIGTARYMAPERVTGGAASAASDVYALGVLGYECLAGSVPFEGASDIAVALAHAHDPVPPLPADVPRPMADLIMGMLAKDPAERPSATVVAAAARPLAGPFRTGAPAEPSSPAVTDLPPTLPISSAAPTTPMPDPLSPGHGDGSRPWWRQPLWLAIAAAAGIAVLALLVALAVGGQSAQPNRPAASPSAAATHKPSASTTVTVTGSRYVGETWTSAAAQLRRLGVVPHRTDVTGPVGRVISVSPTGTLHRGSAVSVSVGTAPTPPGPAATPPGHGHGHGPGPGGPGNGNGKGHGPGDG